MIDLIGLKEIIEDCKLVEGFDDCVMNPAYRIGECYTLTYDYDLVSSKIISNYSADYDYDNIYSYILNNFDTEQTSFIKVLPKEFCNRDSISAVDEDMLFCDGLDDALIGYRVGFNENKNIAAYDYESCINCLFDNGMTYEDAAEWMSYNVMDSYVGEYTPCFIHKI